MSPNANSNWSAVGSGARERVATHSTRLDLGCTISDELPDVSKLRITLTVNGQLKQNGSTETMIFPPAQLVHYISQFMTLEPGDLISTGTPPGVGLGMKPPRYLKRGDNVELEIQHLGKQRQSCRQA